MTVVVFGSVNMDIVLSVDRLPVAGETVNASSIMRMPGGKGANQAIACARYGVATSMIGSIGDDDFGASLICYLKDNFVDTAGLETLENQATGQAHICVSAQGENTIVVVPGANHAGRGTSGAGCGTEAKVHLAQFEMPLEQVRQFLEKKNPQSISIINTAPAVIGGDRLFALADILVMNETELATYSGTHVEKSDDIGVVRSARKLLSTRQQHIVVTLGSRGAVIVGADTHVQIEALTVKSIDTTGAGDCFCGVMAACLANGENLEAAVRMANSAAGISTTRSGAAPSMPARREVELMLK